MASEVWSYFKIDQANNKFAKCNICSKLISRGGGSKSTSNLMKHLKSHNIGTTSIKKPSQSPSQALVKSFFTKPAPSTVTSNDPVLGLAVDNPDLSKPSTSSSGQFKLPTEAQSPPAIEPLVDVTYDRPTPSKSPNLSKDLPQPLELEIPASQFFMTDFSDSDTFDDPSGPDSEVSSHKSMSPQGPSYPKRIKLKEAKQTTLTSLADRMSKFKPTDRRALHINNLIGEMISLDQQPFSVVENKGFRRLINHLEPRYTIPSRKTFSKKILPDMYDEVHRKVEKQMMDVSHVAITTDMWTNISQVDFMAVTAHFFESNGSRVHRCLEVAPFPEVSHTGNNLLAFLQKVLNDWNIKDKVVAVVRDNGTDITSALQRSEYTAIPCVAHTLQLVIKDGFFSNTKISNLISKTKKLVGSFKHSAKNTKILKQQQIKLGIKSHKLIQDEPTRWNTTFYMFKRILEQRQALILVMANPDTKLSVEMTSDDWKTMEHAVEMLEIFENATLQLSKANSSISEVIPMCHTIQHFLEARAPPGSGLQGLKNDMLASLRRRFSRIEDNMVYARATLLDPRFKMKPFKDKGNMELAKTMVINEATALATVESVPEAASASPEQEEEQNKGFWAHYEAVFGTEKEGPQKTTNLFRDVENDLNSYLNEPNLSTKLGEHIADYWKSCNLHKNISLIAQKYLCIPPCTVFSERLFSVAGNICDNKRNRLDPDSIKMLVFLNRNLD